MLGSITVSGSLIGALREELDSFEPSLFPPVEKPREGEKTLQTIEDPEVQKMYALGSFYAKEAASIGVQASFSADDEELERAATLMHRYKRLSAILNNFFWLSLELKLNLKAEHMGIRRDWVVVDRTEAPDFKNENGPAGFFKQMLGD